MAFFEKYLLNHFPDIMMTIAIAFIALVTYGIVMS
jgi:hypothetical protein